MFYFLLLFHFIGDFLFQTREVAKNKASNMFVMWEHISGISVVFIIGLLFLKVSWLSLGSFVACYCLLHFLQDTFIWRSYKYGKKADFKFWEDKMFWNVLGLDQMLHIATLYFLWRLFL